MVRESLIIKTDKGLGENNPLFHNIEITEYLNERSRMGMPSLTATLMWPTCLDEEWSGLEYVTLMGERYYIRETPTSSKDNTDARYKHDIEFSCERAEILNNVYFFDVVRRGGISYDKPCSNSTKFTFFGNIREFLDRLNCAFRYMGIGDSILDEKTTLDITDVPNGDGYCAVFDPRGDFDSEAIVELSWEDEYLWDAITQSYEKFEIPYQFDGKRMIWGGKPEVVNRVFKYGVDNELLSVKKNNANAKVITSITFKGSTENIPYYYPNDSEYGFLTIAASEDNTILTTDKLSIENPALLCAKLKVDEPITLKKHIPPILTSASAYAMIGDAVMTARTESGFNPATVQGAIFEQHQDFNWWKVTQNSKMWQWNSAVYLRVEIVVLKSSHIIIDGLYGTMWQTNETPDFTSRNLIDEKTRATLVRKTEAGSGGTIFHSREAGKEKLFDLGELETGRYELSLELGWKWRSQYTANTMNIGIESLPLKAPGEGETDIKYYWVQGDLKFSDTSFFGIKIDESVDLESVVGESIYWSAHDRMAFQTNLMPPKYRNTLGDERFYNAYNKPYTEEYAIKHPEAYIDPDTGNPYDFITPYVQGFPVQATYTNEKIKPTIEGVVNGQSKLLGEIVAVAYDDDDNDSLKADKGTDDSSDSLSYEHSYFYVKLNIFNGDYGFNLFAHASQTGNMTLQMRSGSCNGCKFEVGVVEIEENGVKVFKNPVQTTGPNGDIVAGGFNEKVDTNNIQDWQQDSSKNSIWIALKKDINTFGTILPSIQTSIAVKAKDKFNIINIDLPKAYILAAEKKGEEEMMRHMSDNNEEKFTFDISASRIFFAENPNLLNEITENSKIKVEYNGHIYEQYISTLTINCRDNEVLPEIRLSLVDTVSVGQSFESKVAERASSMIANAYTLNGVIGGRGGFNWRLADDRYLQRHQADEYYLSKTRADRTQKLLSSDIGFEIGDFLSGARGGIFNVDPDTGETYIEADRARFRMKAIFESLQIAQTESIRGQLIISSGGSIEISYVETIESEDVYRCYFKVQDNDKSAKCQFVVDDLVKTQQFNISAGTYSDAENQFYWRRVVAVNNDDAYFDLSISDCAEGSTVPNAGDVACQLGNVSDKTRQAAIVLSTVGDFAPVVTLYHGINSFSLADKSIIEYGMDMKDPSNPEPFFNCYGRTYVGPKNKSTYFKYTPDGGVEIRGNFSAKSKIDDTPIDEYIGDKASGQIKTRYSADGVNWHDEFIDVADVYMQVSTDGGQNWGDPIRIVGKDGADFSYNMLRNANVQLGPNDDYMLGIYEWDGVDNIPLVDDVVTISVCGKVGPKDEVVTIFFDYGSVFAAQIGKKTEDVTVFKGVKRQNILGTIDSMQNSAMALYHAPNDDDFDETETYVKWVVVQRGITDGVSEWIPAVSDLKGKDGEDAVNYSIYTDPQVVTIDVNGNLSSNRITAVKMKQIGSQPMTAIDYGFALSAVIVGSNGASEEKFIANPNNSAGTVHIDTDTQAVIFTMYSIDTDPYTIISRVAVPVSTNLGGTSIVRDNMLILTNYGDRGWQIVADKNAYYRKGSDGDSVVFYSQHERENDSSDSTFERFEFTTYHAPENNWLGYIPPIRQDIEYTLSFRCMAELWSDLDINFEVYIGDGSDSPAMVAQQATVENDGEYHYLTFTFTAQRDMTQYDKVVINVSANGINTWSIVKIKDLKLEKGATPTPWSRASSDVERRLLDTGIDIKGRQVTVTADNFKVQNNEGQQTFLVDENGNVNADLINAQKVMCYNELGQLISSVNANGDGAYTIYHIGTLMPMLTFRSDPTTNSCIQAYNADGSLAWTLGLSGVIATPTNDASKYYTLTETYLKSFTDDAAAKTTSANAGSQHKFYILRSSSEEVVSATDTAKRRWIDYDGVYLNTVNDAMPNASQVVSALLADDYVKNAVYYSVGITEVPNSSTDMDDAGDGVTVKTYRRYKYQFFTADSFKYIVTSFVDFTSRQLSD